MRISLKAFTMLVVCLGALIPAEADDAVIDLTTIDRTIGRQPIYQGQPYYALLVFGKKAERRAWLVVDGQDLVYVDRNGNGDLTDPGDRVPLDLVATRKLHGRAPGDFRTHVFALGMVCGEEFEFYLSIPKPTADAVHKQSAEKQSPEFAKKQSVSGMLNRVLMKPTKTQVVSRVMLTSDPESSQISHFHGLLAFVPASDEPLQLAPWPLRSRLEVRFGWQNLPAKGGPELPFLLTHLAPGEMSSTVHPIAMLTFPRQALDGGMAAPSFTLELDPSDSVFRGLFRGPRTVAIDQIVVNVNVPADAAVPAVGAKLTVPVEHRNANQIEGLLVMFHDADMTLKQVVPALRKRGLDINIEADHLDVRKDGFRSIEIRLVRDNEVRGIAEAIGSQTESTALARCDSYFEVRFSDSKRWLNEQQTLATIQESLQKVTQGFAYRTWDRRLIAPSQ